MNEATADRQTKPTDWGFQSACIVYMHLGRQEEHKKLTPEIPVQLDTLFRHFRTIQPVRTMATN